MFSTTWKSSIKPGKQRKYRLKAPLHIRSKFLAVHLSDDISKKYSKRSARIKTGDKVKVIKGQFKGKTGKVERIDTKTTRIYISGLEFQKKDGTKIRYPVSPASLVITELDLNDKRRQESLKRR
jgi:large subunit ribosomal protein L24